jgi:hypothetical protein
MAPFRIVDEPHKSEIDGLGIDRLSMTTASPRASNSMLDIGNGRADSKDGDAGDAFPQHFPLK